MDKTDREEQSKSVVVVGAGGNIGSHQVRHLGRMPEVGRVMLIDRDVYEAKNLRSQDITPKDVGKPKAKVLARRLRDINPALIVEAVVDAVENVPLAWLRGDVILACLDSREARRYVNQAAWRLGVPWIDAGVEPGSLLARIEGYVPTLDGGPCLECGWDEQDYALLEQRYPCQGEASGPAPTNGSSGLGALAASLQAIECQKLLAGQTDQLAVGRQVLIDASFHKHYVTRLTQNPHCRFDHETWTIERRGRGRGHLTIGRALALSGKGPQGDGSPALRVEGKAFVRTMRCMNCEQQRKTLRLEGRLRSAEETCSRCGRQMVPVGFEMLEQLDRTLPKKCLARTLGSVGLQPGDVYSICSAQGKSHHYEIGDDR